MVGEYTWWRISVSETDELCPMPNEPLHAAVCGH
jgi:hypothetical protein